MHLIRRRIAFEIFKNKQMTFSGSLCKNSTEKFDIMTATGNVQVPNKSSKRAIPFE